MGDASRERTALRTKKGGDGNRFFWSLAKSYSDITESVLREDAKCFGFLNCLSTLVYVELAIKTPQVSFHSSN